MLSRFTPVLLVVLALSSTFAACRLIEDYGPTPTRLAPVRDYDRLSAAQIAEHYQRCLKRVDRDHQDLQNVSPPALADYYDFDRTTTTSTGLNSRLSIRTAWSSTTGPSPGRRGTLPRKLRPRWFRLRQLSHPTKLLRAATSDRVLWRRRVRL
ncbi:MAG: hypothetical protein F4X66_03840 [Chloroflexi bacterium]|nr:hypothetical protein [Chloroflexota bacterium]MYE41817.1 hypothetical protein [Chloroflexota bacterium]